MKGDYWFFFFFFLYKISLFEANQFNPRRFWYKQEKRVVSFYLSSTKSKSNTQKKRDNKDRRWHLCYSFQQNQYEQSQREREKSEVTLFVILREILIQKLTGEEQARI
ncbi:hypothetical protein E2542_SST25882 [Spatholobus suberectus]|nr:hypothetical protein E2542_SST25882 [Spatholobus suberectus]